MRFELIIGVWNGYWGVVNWPWLFMFRQTFRCTRYLYTKCQDPYFGLLTTWFSIFYGLLTTGFSNFYGLGHVIGWNSIWWVGIALLNLKIMGHGTQKKFQIWWCNIEKTFMKGSIHRESMAESLAGKIFQGVRDWTVDHDEKKCIKCLSIIWSSLPWAFHIMGQWVVWHMSWGASTTNVLFCRRELHIKEIKNDIYS